MSSLIQTIAIKGVEKHEEALEATKRLKKFLEGKGTNVRAFWALEAGAASGVALIAIEFPNAAAWAKLVDDREPDMEEFRRRFVQAEHVVGTSLMQEIELS